MIRFKLQAEPANFDARCRKRGLRWLRANPCYEGRPCDYWSEFEPQLRNAFNGLCGYCAMLVMKAQVDHFIPVALLKVQGKDTLAYEWSNYRYGEGVLNQKKGKHKILDPFEVGDDWFEVLLPSLQLVITPNVPRRKRKLSRVHARKTGTAGQRGGGQVSSRVVQDVSGAQADLGWSATVCAACGACG